MDSPPSTTPPPSIFFGDGSYPNDGGSLLQQLWGLTKWRELRNCPGRYVTRHKPLQQQHPDAVVDAIMLLQGDDGSNKSKRTRLPPLSFKPNPERDEIVVNVLVGGGALLTYVKTNSAKKNPTNTSTDTTTTTATATTATTTSLSTITAPPTFVHTFNTESGLIRKVDALGLAVQVGQALPLGTRRTIFHFVLTVIGLLDAKDKNAAATVLVRWAKRMMWHRHFQLR